jgi:hypothetical protein
MPPPPPSTYHRNFVALSMEEFKLDHSLWLDLISEAHSHVDQVRAAKGLSKWDWTPKVDSPFKRERKKRRIKMRSIAAKAGN